MDEFPGMFAAWRVIHLESREVIDAIVAADHRGPSPALTKALTGWRGASYWADRAKTRLVLVRATSEDAHRWWLHVTLFVVTILCSMAAGAALAGVWYPTGHPGIAGGLQSAYEFLVGTFHGDWRLFLTGWSFALPLLGILVVHEYGHYIAARRYGIDTTPPFFIPVPPTLSPIGSLGAFIRLRSPVLDRRQLTDVGAAGPLAGFVVALGVLVWGYLTSERLPMDPGMARSYVVWAGSDIFLGESLLTRALRDWLLPGNTAVHLSGPAFAGWVGCFITGLNLLPLSQLDGGHVMHGLLGRRQGALALLTIGGLLYLSRFSSSWLVWVVMTFLIGGGRWTHPSVMIPDRPVPASRRWVGLACVAVFIATFVPIPFVDA
ncbi:MAG: site-2 protease family protein [Gemmatimonadota bacterium]